MGYIYKITNTVNNKAYIGQTTQKLEKRMYRHFNFNEKGCPAIHNAIEKYGREAFTVEILHDGVLNIFLDDLEIAEIKKHNTFAPNGYNLHGGGNANRVVSDQTRKKMSESQKGKTHTPDSRKKMSDAKKGKSKSLETRSNMSKAQKGRKCKPISPEHRQNLSKALKGRTLSPEYRQNLSKVFKGRTFTPETRKKMSLAGAHPDRPQAFKILNALPESTPLAEKRRILYNKFPEISKRTARNWIKKWSETSSN